MAAKLARSIQLLALLAAFAPAAHAQAPSCSPSTGTGKSFAGQNLTDHNFRADPPGSLVGANFTGATLNGAVFAGQDLTNARFQNARLGPGKRPVDFTNATLANTCFAGATLDATDFSFAVIACADFSGTSMIQARFGPTQSFRDGAGCRTKFVGATLDVHLITTDAAGKSNWSRSDFTGANFQNLTPQTFNLRNKDISGAILAKTSFIGIDMSGANLTDVDFSGARLMNAHLDGAVMNGAKLVDAQAASVTFVCAQAYGTGGGQKKADGTKCDAPRFTSAKPQSPADFTGAGLKDTDFTGATLDHACLSGASLTGATFDNASLAQANLQAKGASPSPGCVARSADAANVQYATFTNTNFTGAQLSSVKFNGATLTGASFDGTTLDSTSFNGATMPTATFRQATLQSVDFGNAIAQSVDFSGVTILETPPGKANTDFQCAQLGGADFKNSHVRSGNFSNAVMPAVSDCCPAQGIANPVCGIIGAPLQPYPPTTFPIVEGTVTCPNRDNGKCQGDQWRLSPSWQTAQCGDGKTPRTMWSRPQCDGKATDIVVFRDRNLKDCILGTLPGQPAEVTAAAAAQMQRVVCPARGIADVTGLERFGSLVKLDLSGNRLSTFALSFTTGGSNLRTLDLDDNQLTTLDVSAHPLLAYLSAANNRVATIATSADFAPTVLNLSGNQLQTFDFAFQTGLAYVDLSSNQLTSVTDAYNPNLRKLGSLTYLDLSGNKLTSVGSIAAIAANSQSGVGSLQALFLTCNPNFKCDSLEISDGTKYPAVATSTCSRYDPSHGTWNPVPHPDPCPAGVEARTTPTTRRSP